MNFYDHEKRDAWLKLSNIKINMLIEQFLFTLTSKQLLTQFSVAFRVFSWVLVGQPLTNGYWRTWKSLTSCVSEVQEGPHSQMISNIRQSKVSHVPFSFYFFCAPSVQNFHPSLGGQNVFNHIWQCFVFYGKKKFGLCHVSIKFFYRVINFCI